MAHITAHGREGEVREGDGGTVTGALEAGKRRGRARKAEEGGASYINNRRYEVSYRKTDNSSSSIFGISSDLKIYCADLMIVRLFVSKIRFTKTS